ncbi:hypothetical protein JZ751_011633 [Albula glossodonta]|uniref:Kinetochore protein Spc24 n=1 Tax=Albula glossodonta TaxID=121402 RepID=A0A8T2MM75_9TELE|nr:hypothetical protein JZ751_011633 [Albula glossodonta]
MRACGAEAAGLQGEKSDAARGLEALEQDLQRSVAKNQTMEAELQYLAQLYYKVTKIKWEMDTEPGTLKGVHYGEDLASPITVDTTSQSKCAISDYLWSFVSTEW